MLKENDLGHDGFSNFTPWYAPDMSRVELNESYHYSSFPSGIRVLPYTFSYFVRFIRCFRACAIKSG